MWKRFTCSTIALPPRLNLWDFDVRFVQKINRCTDKCSAGMCLNSQIDAVRPLHFYRAMCNRFQSTQTVVVIDVVVSKFPLIVKAFLIHYFTNQGKTKFKKLITYRCKKLILSVFRAKMFFQHFLGYKVDYVNQASSYEKCDLVIDVKRWFWAFFAPKYFSAVFWTIRSTT